MRSTVAAQLDVAAYLAASRTAFAAGAAYLPMALDWQRDVTFGLDVIGVGELRTRYLISCEGYAASRNPLFSWVPFNAAKGEILTVRFERALADQQRLCLHRGVWLAPTNDRQVFRVGSTYDLATLDQRPTAAARAEIERKLREFVHVPYAVLDHQAAVRPIIQLSQAMIGLHPRHRGLGYFNGLGSKGSLHAPWFAQRFADHLTGGVSLPPDLDVRKHA
jgi:glycine oxidase